MLVVDIRHWLNETTTGPAVPQLKNKVNKLGEIISFVTDIDGNHPPPKCSRRPGRDDLRLARIVMGHAQG